MTVEVFEPADVYTIQTTGPYAIPFSYASTSDLIVQAFDAENETTLVPDVDYTVSPAGPASSGEITLSSNAFATHSGRNLQILRNTFLEQGYVSQGGPREAGLEAQLDRIVRALQDRGADLVFIREDIKRTVRVPENEPAIGVLPLIADRAGLFLGFSETGQPLAAALPAVSVTDGQRISAWTAIGSLQIDPDVDTIYTDAYAVPGDGGGAKYTRHASQPAVGGVQDALGNWWKLTEPAVYPQMFGARANGLTDDHAALQAAIDYCLETQATLLLRGDYFCDGALSANQAINIVGGMSSRVENVGGNEQTVYIDGITFTADHGLTFLRDEGQDSTIQSLSLLDFYLRDAGTSVAPANRWSWDKTELLLVHRATKINIRGFEIDGALRRNIGAHFGLGNTMWASGVYLSRFRRSQIGCVIGGTNDATNIAVYGNRFDQNMSIGCEIWNIVSGLISENGFEQNPGATGVYFRSTSSRAKNGTLANNYIFNNGTAEPDLAGSAGIRVGGTPPRTDFSQEDQLTRASTTQAWTINVADNYAVNDDCRYSIIFEGGRAGQIVRNTVQSHVGTTASDINLSSGAGADTVVQGNVDQENNNRDDVDYDNAGYRRFMQIDQSGETLDDVMTLTMGVGGAITFDAVAEFRADRIRLGANVAGFMKNVDFGQISGTAESATWTDMFNTQTDLPSAGRGKARLELLIEQTDGDLQQSVTLEVRSALRLTGSSVTPAAYTLIRFDPNPVLDNLEFRMDPSRLHVLQYRRNNASQYNGATVSVDAPFSDA